jgi:hypothetical protein
MKRILALSMLVLLVGVALSHQLAEDDDDFE